MSNRYALVKPIDESDPSPPRTHIAHPASQRQRKKGARARTWLVVDSSSQTQSVNVGKHSIMCRTGLLARDLRILDPFLSYPSTIMGRERAIVINLEHLKGIITAQDVWLLNFKDPVVAAFIEELQRRFSDYQQAIAAKARESGGCEEKTEEALHQNLQVSHKKAETKELQQHKSKTLPFEFVALEICLDSVCSSLDEEVKAFELEAYPALDKLTSKLSTSRLERVRQIKGRLVSITGRVQKIKDEIAHLLEHEGVLAEMHLTEKIIQEGDDNSQALPTTVHKNKDEYGREPDKEENEEGEAGESEDDGEILPNEGMTGNPHSVSTKHINVVELEMLLEAYLVQVEGTLNKLSTLKEYVDGTEDYVTITLDDMQNNLLQTMIVMSLASLVLTIPNIWSGFLAANIDNTLYNEKHGTFNFTWVTAGNVFGPLLIFVGFYVWFKKKNYL